MIKKKLKIKMKGIQKVNDKSTTGTWPDFIEDNLLASLQIMAIDSNQYQQYAQYIFNNRIYGADGGISDLRISSLPQQQPQGRTAEMRIFDDIHTTEDSQ